MSINDRKAKPSLVYNNVQPLYKIGYTKASDIIDRPQSWLWEGFIPYETCTLIAGVPGIGKSQFLMWFASIVSQGAEFSLNSLKYSVDQGSVLILACEDSMETGIVPRLKSLNANLEKVFIMRCMEDRENDDDRRLIALDTDMPAIEALIDQIGDVKLIIIDPITGFSGRTRDHIDAEVRNLLNKLNELAEKKKVAIIINKHLRKPKGDGISAAINEVAGSGAWVAVVRQSFIISPYHEDETKILFSNLKVNISKKTTEAFSYTIQGHRYINAHGQEIETSHLVWENGTIKINADEALNKQAYQDKSKTKQAAEFLLEKLRDQSLPATELINEVREKFGLCESIIYEIKKKLHISSDYGINRKKIWFLSPESPFSVD